MSKSKNNIGILDPNITDSFQTDKIDAGEQAYLEKKVRFSLKYSLTDKNSIGAITDREKLRQLFKKLGYFEEMTIRQLRQLDHKRGLSIEGKESGNYRLLVDEFGQHGFNTFYHFRTQLNSMFRVFGSSRGDLYYLLLFDPDGKVNH